MQNGKRRFALTNCEGMKWSDAIGLPVVVDDTIEQTPAETVAAIIEEMDREMEEGELTHYNPDEDDDDEEELLPLSPEEEERKRMEERAEKVEYAMMELLSQSEGLCVKDLLYLLDTSLICEIYPHTYAYDTTKRMDYMLDLLDNYCEVKYNFNRVAFCVTSSPLYPISEEEARLLGKLKALVEGGEVLMVKRQHMAIEKELHAIILFSKN